MEFHSVLTFNICIINICEYLGCDDSSNLLLVTNQYYKYDNLRSVYCELIPGFKSINKKDIRYLSHCTSLKCLQQCSNVISVIFDDSFNEDLTDIELPTSLINITFGASFNKLIPKEILKHVKSLKFGNYYCLSLNLPYSLENLVLGTMWNYSINDSTFSPNLKSLTLGDAFDSTIYSLPMHLEELHFGYQFNKPLDDILPPNLKVLTLGTMYSEKINLPRTLEILNVCFNYTHLELLKEYNKRNKLKIYVYASKTYNRTAIQQYCELEVDYTNTLKTTPTLPHIDNVLESAQNINKTNDIFKNGENKVLLEDININHNVTSLLFSDNTTNDNINFMNDTKLIPDYKENKLQQFGRGQGGLYLGQFINNDQQIPDNKENKLRQFRHNADRWYIDNKHFTNDRSSFDTKIDINEQKNIENVEPLLNNDIKNNDDKQQTNINDEILLDKDEMSNIPSLYTLLNNNAPKQNKFMLFCTSIKNKLTLCNTCNTCNKKEEVEI